MTRSYAAKRLLEHGPLSVNEFRQITGWPYFVATRALQTLLDSGVARRVSGPGVRGYIYELVP